MILNYLDILDLHIYVKFQTIFDFVFVFEN